MSKTELTEKEAALIDNIINKLQIYMDKTQQTLHSLSANLGFEYQPFYRLMRNRKLPTISSVAMITEHLNCTIEELISDKMLIDVKMFTDFDEFVAKGSSQELVKIYVPIGEYIPNLKNEFFTIKESSLETQEIDICNLYATISNINNEGIYVVKKEDKYLKLNIISTSTKFIIAESGGKEIRIPQEELEPIAKFIKPVILIKTGSDYLQGFKG